LRQKLLKNLSGKIKNICFILPIHFEQTFIGMSNMFQQLASQRQQQQQQLQVPSFVSNPYISYMGINPYGFMPPRTGFGMMGGTLIQNDIFMGSSPYQSQSSSMYPGMYPSISSDSYYDRYQNLDYDFGSLRAPQTRSLASPGNGFYGF
jgi:hypothetical protein